MSRLGKVGGFGLVSVFLIATGCQDPKEPQILGLQDQNAELARENEDIKSQLQYAYNERDAARAERDAARGRTNELQSLLDECRRRISDQPFEKIQNTSNLTQAPPQDGVWMSSGNVAMVTLSQDILFDSGQAKLKGNAKDTVRQIASDLRGQYAGRKILVIGHTDTDPIRKTKNLWEDNLDLSANRAMAVVRELYDAGIPKKDLYAAGQGEWNPREEGGRDSKKANRRVEIVAIAG
ncbi:MAG: flagellar motor protein MotB [Phycisphaerae bacterium]